MVKIVKVPDGTPKRRTLADRVPGPLAAWSRSVFGRDRDLEDADGERVGGIRLHLGPDGRLYGVIESEREEGRKP